MPLQPDARVADRWLVRERLAVGGMGEVWRAEDVRSGADVAVKVLRPGVAAGERRFAAEIAALEVLRHPNIVRLIAAGVHPGPDGDAPYFVMDLVTGPSLAERLEDGPVEPAPARRVGSDVAAALAAAHAHDIVHRDVKPSNILLAADGRVRLADFGIARTLDMTSLTATGFAIGTASYVAPEQLSDARGVGPAADVYALGLVLFESLTGDRAFDGSPAEAAMARLHRDLLIPDDLPDPWPRLLTAMTARAPAHRPSAGAVVAILRAPAGSGQETRELLRLPSPPAGGVGPAAPAEVPTSAGAEPASVAGDGPEPTAPFAVPVEVARRATAIAATATGTAPGGAPGTASGRAPGTAPGGAVDPDAIGAGGEPVPERSTSTSDLAGSSDPAGSSEAQSTAFDRASHGEGDDGSSSVWRRGWRPVLLGFAALLLVWLLALFGPLRSDPPAETGTPSPLPAELDDAFQRLERELAP